MAQRKLQFPKPVMITSAPRRDGRVSVHYYAGGRGLARRAITAEEYEAALAAWATGKAQDAPKGAAKPAASPAERLAAITHPMRSASRLAEGALDDPSIGDLIIAWRASTKWRSLAPASRASYEATLASKHFAELYAVKANTVEPRHLRRIAEAIANRRDRIHGGAANNFLRVFSALWSWGEGYARLTVANPAQKVDQYRREHHRPWSDAEIGAVLAEAGPRAGVAPIAPLMRRFILLALHTAQRRGDVCRLTWADYDAETATFRFVPQKTQHHYTHGRMLEIRVPALAPELARWRAEAAARLLARGAGLDRLASSSVIGNGRVISGVHIGALWWHERTRLGLGEHLHLHGLRASAASRMIEAGMTSRDAMAITGHTSEAAFAVYVAHAEQAVAMRRAAAALAANLPAIAGGSRE